MIAGPYPRPAPLQSHQTPAEIIALGQRMGVPEISWGVDRDGFFRVIYHWDHGDRVIYPTEEIRSEDAQDQEPAVRLTTDARSPVRRPCLLCRGEVERWRRLLGGSYCGHCVERIKDEVEAQRLRIKARLRARFSRRWRQL